MWRSDQFVALIASGGSAEIWKIAVTIGGGTRPAALKVYFSEHDSADGQLQLRRIRWVIAMNHPGLMCIHVVGKFTNRWSLQMDFAARTLWDIFQQEPHRSLPSVVQYIRAAAATLDSLRQNGVAHCGITPLDILILGGEVRLTDSSLMHRIGNSFQAPARMGLLGSACMSPEVSKQTPGAYSDQYSLATSYAMIRVGSLRIGSPVARPFDLSMACAAERAVVERAMSLDPSKRFPTCTEFVERLDDAIRG